jgi:hypothetical protein
MYINTSYLTFKRLRHVVIKNLIVSENSFIIYFKIKTLLLYSRVLENSNSFKPPSYKEVIITAQELIS